MKQEMKGGDERDWVSKKSRYLLGMEKKPGLGKRIKRAMNKRARKDIDDLTSI